MEAYGFLKAIHDQKPEVKQEMIKMQKEYPAAFKYLVIFPYFQANIEEDYSKEFIEKRFRFFKKIHKIAESSAYIDIFEDVAEFLYLQYPKTMSQLKPEYIEKLFTLV